MVKCQNCQSLQNDGAKICSNCGANLIPGNGNHIATPSYNFKPPKTSIFKEMVCCILVVALLLGTIIGYKYSTEERTTYKRPVHTVFLDDISTYVLYIRDDNLFFDPCDGSSPILLEYNYVPYNDIDESYYVSLDKTKVVYVVENGDGQYKLRRCDVSSDSAKTFDICDNVGDWNVNADASEIVYIDKSTDYIFRYSFENDRSVNLSTVADNLQHIGNDGLIFYTHNDVFYCLDSNEAYSSRIAESFEGIQHITSDALYYSCDNNESRSVGKFSFENKSDETLVSDIEYVIKIYDSGEMYYKKKDIIYKNGESEEVSLIYYRSTYGTTDVCLSDEDSIVITTAEDRAYIAFYEKSLLDGKMTLCVVEQDLRTRFSSNIDNIMLGGNENEFLYTANCNDETKSGELYSVIYSGDRFIPATLIDTDVFKHSVTVTDNGKIMYLKNYDMGNEVGDLYADGSFVDDNVSAISSKCFKNSVLYHKDRIYENDSFSYTLMAYDGYNTEISPSVLNYEITDKYLYYTVATGDPENSRLFNYNGSVTNIISENVASGIIPLAENTILFAKEFDSSDFSYDLYMFDDGNIKDIAFGVKRLFPCNYSYFSNLDKLGKNIAEYYSYRIYSINPPSN